MTLQFESSVQNLVYQMDAGTGRRIVQALLAVLFAVAMAVLYTFSNFQGLKDARAMDQAQVARNLAIRGTWATQAVRPISIGLLAERAPESGGSVFDHPDLLYPPGWPFLLSLAFRATGIPQVGMPTQAFVHGPDYVPVALNHLFALLYAQWVSLIARKNFYGRVAALSLIA